MSTEVMTIQDVRCYVDANGTAYLDAETVARGLGFTQTKGNVEYVRWETVNKYLNEFGYNSFSQLVGKGDFIPENMFYRLAMKANNAAAQKFQAKVADEVLPSIRKTGAYITPQASTSPQAMITLLRNAADTIEKLQAQVAVLKPDAEYCREVLKSNADMLPTTVAKALGTSVTKFHRWLVQSDFAFFKGTEHRVCHLKTDYSGKGYERYLPVLCKDGKYREQMFWTQQGFKWIRELWRSQQSAQIALF